MFVVLAMHYYHTVPRGGIQTGPLGCETLCTLLADHPGAEDHVYDWNERKKHQPMCACF